MNTIEQLRRRVIDDVMALSTMEKVWPIWQPNIRDIASGSPPDADDLIRIGNSLSEIFKSSAQAGRSQSDVSAGGTVWEALVCWYLNLCLIGSRTVVVKSKKIFVPDPISSSITVMYGAIPSNTESDLLAITFPKACYDENKNFNSPKLLKEYFNTQLKSKFSESELTVIQCKTNWNDNAQIPMLWDLIYQSTGFKANASVGANGYVNSGLKRFSYAFVTVPTVDPLKIKSTSTCVLRVKSLSGGNYWGLPANTGVALNVFDLITKNFQTSLAGYENSWPHDIQHEISRMINEGNYFKF